MQHNCAGLISEATTDEKGSKTLGVSKCMNYFSLKQAEMCLDSNNQIFFQFVFLDTLRVYYSKTVVFFCEDVPTGNHLSVERHM